MSDTKLTIRAYNVGFGDSFLLRFEHGAARPFRMLIDCGVHGGGGSGHKISEIVKTIIADCTDPDGPHIDVVVVTHRHLDHVSGFTCADDWQQVTVGEVWLPFTENPDDSLGRSIRNEQSRKIKKLHLALQALALDGEAARAARVVENSLTNEPAMRVLRSGFNNTPKLRYFPKPDGASSVFALDGLPDVTVHMLGPRRDRAAVALMDPPEEEDWLRALAPLRAAAAPVGGRANAGAGFAKEFVVTPEEIQRGHRDLFLNQKQRRELDEQATADAWAAAALASDSVNNTSLFFVLEIRGKFLLFPGDAQWGLWDLILGDPEARAVLDAVSLYKVGHHGSHNATAHTFAAKLLSGRATSLMSTHDCDDWPIPDPNLVDELERGNRTLHSTKELGDSKRADSLYFDYRVPL